MSNASRYQPSSVFEDYLTWTTKEKVTMKVKVTPLYAPTEYCVQQRMEKILRQRWVYMKSISKLFQQQQQQ